MTALMATGKPLFAPMGPTIDYAFYPRVPNISLELTANCNLKCPYCANGSLTRPKDYIEWSLLEKIVDEAADGRLNISHLHGVGEPLLWDRLEEVVALIRRRNAGLGSFGTNGTLLYEDRFRKLLDAGLTEIYISIDSLDPKIYKATRAGKIEKVIANIKRALAIAPPDFTITVALMNHKTQTLGPEQRAQFREVFGEQPNLVLNEVENQYFPGARDDYRTSPEKMEQCFSPVNFLFIATDGRAAICCMDQDVKHAIGDVRERSINDIWFDPRNQTTFRNIALGVYECPDACVTDCVLKEPKQGHAAATVGFATPFDTALKMAEVLAFSGELQQSGIILEQLLRRDPKNQEIPQYLNNIAQALEQQALQQRAMQQQVRSA